ncbi:dermonecrotic toxin domain-containing protein [Luteibacter aegosomaticola]|uniref:dermonecrotic toxin domain-containing protein n=1 Tax=Luteibacter aegosomaticola TaxID=2911538 RepID=UPI0031B85229
MLPPQAPPASIQHANQAARDTLSRLGDAQQWLARQQGELPEPPYESLGRLTQSLDAFWSTPVESAPGADPAARRRAFAQRLAQVARDDASLRISDGTLPGTVADTISALTGPAPNAASPLTTSELLVAGKAYAGALMVEDVRHPERVLLFTTTGGWEVFASYTDLYAGTLHRLGQMLFSQDDLPGMVGGIPEVNDVLAARPVNGDAFETLTTRILQHQYEKAHHAWQRQLSATPASGDDDRVRSALDLHALLDVHGMVAHRDIALLNLMTESRLASVPAHVREAWERAAIEYDTALVRDDWKRYAGGIAAPSSLMAFAAQALNTRLAALGIHADAAGIRLQLTTMPDSALTFLFNGRDTREVTLLELAYLNTDCARDSVRIVESDDGVHGGQLTPAAVCAMVRELDLGRSYLNYLADLKGPSMAAQTDRALHGDLLLARMRFEAEDARLSYYRPGEPVSFLAAPEATVPSEQGYRWVKNILDHPSPYARPGADGVPLKVQQLTYRGATAGDIVLISAHDEHAQPRIVVYAPGAPQGMVFREFADRATMEREFLLNGAFEPYLAERLPLAFSHISSNGTRRFTLSYLAELGYKISPDTSCGFCTRLEEPFGYKEVTTSFLEDLYFTQVDTSKLDTRHLTRQTREADDDALLATIRFTRIGDDLIYELAKGTIMAIPHAVQAAWRFEDNIRQRDYTEAFLASVAGYTSALNIVPMYSTLPASFAGTVLRRAGATMGVEMVARTIRPADTLFDQRFIARGVQLPRGAAAVEGVYALGDARYIRQGESLYKVRFDNTAKGWRLTRDSAPNAIANGPLIELAGGGQWRFRQVGLLGGKTDLFGEWMQSLPEMVPEARGLTFPQYAALRSRLAESLDPMAAARIYRAYGLNRPTSSTAITPAQQRAWHDALHHARTVARDADIPLSVRVLPSRSPNAPRARALVIDTATDDVLQQLRESAVPQLADFSAVEFDLLVNRLNNHLGTAAERVFRSLGVVRPAFTGAAPTLTERTIWREAVAWVHSLRPIGSPPLPAFLD